MCYVSNFFDRITSSKIQIYDFENKKYLKNYEVLTSFEIENRQIYLVIKKDDDKNDESNIKICYKHNNDLILIN